MSGEQVPSGRRLPRRFQFVRHLLVFLTLSAATLLGEFASGSDWPLFWPLAAWSTVVAIHYLVASAYDLDNSWVEERIFDLQTRSYDFDHIRTIEQRIKDKDPTITPHQERAPKPPES